VLCCLGPLLETDLVLLFGGQVDEAAVRMLVARMLLMVVLLLLLLLVVVILGHGVD
jgi:hypothetical protein